MQRRRQCLSLALSALSLSVRLAHPQKTSTHEITLTETCPERLGDADEHAACLERIKASESLTETSKKWDERTERMMGFLKKLRHLVKASGNRVRWMCILLSWDPGALSYKYDDVPHPQWRLRTCRKPNTLRFLFLCCCPMRSHLSSGRARWVLLALMLPGQ